MQQQAIKELRQQEDFDPKKRYEVRLARTFKIPQIKGVQKQGVVYMRGGYKFCSHVCSENPKGDFIEVSGEEVIAKLFLAKNRVFAHDPVEYELDSQLTAREIK